MRLLLLILGVLVSAGIVGLTSFNAVTVSSSEELAAVPLGWPFPYLSQNQALPPAAAKNFPLTTRFWSPWANPTTIYWDRFTANVGLVMFALWAATSTVGRLIDRDRAILPR
jgi:hypothetical protein